MDKLYDIIIIGEGIAGMTAAIYARRAGADVLILEKGAVGGQAALTYDIGNYPGFKSISGIELVTTIQQQVLSLGVEIRYSKVLDIEDGYIKTVKTKDTTYHCKAVILCLGATPRQLGLNKEQQLSGRGISYCAVCDGAFYRNKVVAVIGRGNVAADDANYLSHIAKKVYIINRRDELKAQEILVDKVLDGVKAGKIELLNNCETKEIIGQEKISGLKVHNMKTNEVFDLEIDGLFVAIGRYADTQWLNHLVDIDENGYIKVDEHKCTNVKGIYAAGDCTNTVLRQLVTASADGAIAATFAYEYAKGIVVE